MNWIKCEDELPDNGDPVIVLFKNGGQWIGKFRGRWYLDYIKRYITEEHFGEAVAFWMPFPKPPTED